MGIASYMRTAYITNFDVIPYSNRISPWLTEFGPLPWQAKQTVSALSQLACHIGGPNSVNISQILLVYGKKSTQKGQS